MNKKLKNLIVVFVLALFVLLYLNSKEKGNVSYDDRSFSLETIEGVDKITISDNLGKEIILENDEGTWLIDAYPIRKEKVSSLMKVVIGLKVRNKVSAEHSDSLLTLFKKSFVLIKYFTGNEEVLSFKALIPIVSTKQAGSSQKKSSKSEGFIVLSESYSTPCYAHVFGEDIDFFQLFSTQTTSWNSLVVADFLDLKITEVCTSYPQEFDFTFCVTANDSIIKFYSAEIQLNGLSVKKGIDYLRAFKKIEAKITFTNKKVISDLINDQSAFFELSILGDGKEIKMTGYKKAAALHQVDYSGRILKHDNEFFYLKCRGNLYLVDYFSFDELIKTAEDFIHE